MRAYKEPSLMVLNAGITLKSSGELFKNRIPQLYSKLIKSEFWGGEGVGPIYIILCVFCFLLWFFHFLTCAHIILPEVLSLKSLSFLHPSISKYLRTYTISTATDIEKWSR